MYHRNGRPKTVSVLPRPIGFQSSDFVGYKPTPESHSNRCPTAINKSRVTGWRRSAGGSVDIRILQTYHWILIHYRPRDFMWITTIDMCQLLMMFCIHENHRVGLIFRNLSRTSFTGTLTCADNIYNT